MKTNNRNLVSIPPPIRSGPGDMMTYLNMIRKSLIELRDQMPPSVVQSKRYRRPLPLEVFNLQKDGSTFTVSVREGYVIERTVINDTGTDCLTYHEPTGILSAGEPVDHTVADGQAIFVKVTVQDDGTISETEIVVDADDTESTHYAPPVGDETAGGVGEYYYKLAEFAADGNTLAITRFHAGANIEHFQELPRFKKAGGTADVFKTFDQAAGEFKTRGLTGASPIIVTQGTDDIEISVDGGWWGTVQWIYYPLGGGSPESIQLHFEGGLLVQVGDETTADIPGTEASPGNVSLTTSDTDT